MEKTTTEQLIEIEVHNKAVSNERIALVQVQVDKENAFRNEKRDKVYAIEQKYDKKTASCRKEIDRISAESDKKVISKKELETKIKLRTIIDHLLTDASCSYGHGQWKSEDVIGEIDGNMFTVTVLVEENNKVNKFTLRFYAGFKNYYLSNYFSDILIGCYNLCQRTFKTKKEALEYSEKNSNNIMSPLYERENELFKLIKRFEYDVLKEFDFRLVRHNVSQERLTSFSQRKATFLFNGYKENSDSCNVEYIGDGEFVVDNDNKELIEKLKIAIAWGNVCRIPEKMIKIKVNIPA